MATEGVVAKLCSLLDSQAPLLQEAAVKCLSTMFASSDPSVVDKAVEAGVLPRFATILAVAPTHLISLVLFGLSNITAGTQDQSRAILLE